jgi:hypothetical protein
MTYPHFSRRSLLVGLLAGTRGAVFPQAQPGLAPAPLFRDPIFDGAADPVVIWNRQEKAWWMLYTQRRATFDGPGVAWVHGCDIGVARSSDNGRTFRYLGILPGLEFERGRNTFWAPEILWRQGAYHMYCSYVPGVPADWNDSRRIVHYTSPDLWKWQCHGPVALSSDRVIDACIEFIPAGRWRMWYKDESHSSHTWAADSTDLHNWKVVGPVITGKGHEGPNVFPWRGAWWMVTDHWDGLGVFRSVDAENWTRQPGNLLQQPGTRRDDAVKGGHADILVQGDQAYVFYFTHPERVPGAPPPPSPTRGVEPYALRRTSIQVARLDTAGDTLTCDRNAAFPFSLQPALDNWSRT